MAPSVLPGTQVMVDTRSAPLRLSPQNNALLMVIPQVLQVDYVPVFWLGVVAAPGGAAPVVTGVMSSTKPSPGVVLTKVLHTLLP
eukprot:7450579-Ditylum_brightwellii.AAC.1